MTALIETLLDLDFEKLIDLLFLGLYFVVGVVSLFCGRFTSKKFNKYMEDFMKCRLPDYREKEPAKGTVFDTEIPQYRLNKQSNELEVLPDKLDIQQVVQSAEPTSLQNMLARLDPDLSEKDLLVEQHSDLLDKLDYARDADNVRLELCSKYGLSPKTSFNDLIKYLSDSEKEVRGQISILQQNKGGKANETQTQSDSSKQET